jgi:uncharacterized protein involved in exopolysaccharide biosynthesis
MVQERDIDSLAERYVYLVPKESESAESNADVPLPDLWRTIWIRRRTVALCALASLIAGTAYALLATNWYRADVVLSPVNDVNNALSGTLSAGGLGDIASLAGIPLHARDGEPVAILRSKTFARAFIEDQQLMPVLFANKWDEQTHAWKVKGSDQPDIRDGVKYFDEKIRKVTEDKKTGLVTLSITWKDASEASRWANLLVKRVNDRVRTDAMREAETSIGYLQKELLAANAVSLQQTIARVLENQMQKMALARAKEEFAFKVIDEAFPPKRRVWPVRTVIAAASAVLGAMLGMFYVAISQLWRQKVT